MASEKLSDQTVQEWLEDLVHPDINVQAAAFVALRAAGEKAVEPLITALKNGNEFLRIKSAETLGDIRDPRAVEPLILALQDEDELVRVVVIQALGLLGDSQAAEPLIKILQVEDRKIRCVAIEALGKIGDPKALPALELLAKTEDKDEDDFADSISDIAEFAIKQIKIWHEDMPE